VRFLVTGGVVGVLTVGFREAIGLILGSNDATHYSISVLTAYACGIVLSFLINRHYTFGVGRKAAWSRFLRFVPVALTGLLSTWLLSLAIRYETSWLIVPGKYSATAAFALATLISTAITYPLTALVVFRADRQSDEHLRQNAIGARGA
jgi:putative flippase GtrA